MSRIFLAAAVLTMVLVALGVSIRENAFRNMDLHNNNAGRQIGINNLSATSQQLANLVTQALNSGQLQVICPDKCR
jgi:hypothetical protein